jgi:hypothetical protein
MIGSQLRSRRGDSQWPTALAILVSVGLLLASCTVARPNRAVAPRDQYLIEASELETSKNLNLYDAVRRLRPLWLSSDNLGPSGGGIFVYLDGQQVGTVGTLRSFSTDVAELLRYLPATEAQLRFGHINGMRAAIVVETRP